MNTCLKCNRPVDSHPRWTAENIKPCNVSPSLIGKFIGHDPLVSGIGYINA